MFSFESFFHLRLVILAWLTIWVAALPLFHIHVPDTTDRWSAIQSGGAHTVFTRDLPGEYSQPFHGQRGDESHLSGRSVNSPELGIAIFDDPDDRKNKAVPVLATLFHVCECSLRLGRIAIAPHKNRQDQLSPAFSASRAPPQVL